MRSFATAVALISTTIQARNENNGKDRANAQTIMLLDDDLHTLILHTYNSATGDQLEIHGDTELIIKPTTDPTQREPSYQEFGWCIQFNDLSKWDC